MVAPDGDEQRLFEAEVRQVPDEERGKVMELTTSWKEEGLAQGREECRKEATLQLVRRLLVRRLGDLAELDRWLATRQSA